MKLGRRIAMDLTAAQERHMRRAAGTARFAWNDALADHRAMSDAARAESDEARRKALWPTTAKLRARWAERRRAELPWSYEVTKCAGAQAVMDLCAAFDRFGKELRDARCRTRPDRHAAARRLMARRQRRLAQSVAKAKLRTAIAARTVPGRPRDRRRDLGAQRLRQVVRGDRGWLDAG